MIEKLLNRKWKVLHSEYIAKEGPWFTVRREHVELPNGNQVPKWYIFEFPDWVNVIAITKEGQFVMIDQYRHAIGETCYEIPAGMIDPTDACPMDGGKRELMEETGFGGGEWTEFMCTRPNPTNQVNRQYTFLATGVERINNGEQEASEDIRVHLLTRDEVYELLSTGQIQQSLQAGPLWKYFAIKTNNNINH